MAGMFQVVVVYSCYTDLLLIGLLIAVNELVSYIDLHLLLGQANQMLSYHV